MARLTLLGEQVKTDRKIDERTAASIEEILQERDYQDEKWSGLQGMLNKTLEEVQAATLAADKKWSGSDWNGFIDRYQARVKPDMNDPQTRKMFVKIAALALAALRAS